MSPHMIRYSLGVTLLSYAALSTAHAADASVTWQSSVNPFENMMFSIVTPTTPSTGHDQLLSFFGDLMVDLPLSEAVQITGGIQWDLQGWKMVCRYYEDGHIIKQSRVPIRPGTRATVRVAVDPIAGTGSSNITCRVGSPGYPSASVSKGPFRDASMSADRVELHNENINVGNHCNKLVDATVITFESINITNFTPVQTADWSTDVNPSCSRSLAIISDQTQNGRIAIHQSPH